MEEVWNIAKRDIAKNQKITHPFQILKNTISRYFRTKKFRT